MTTPQLVRLHVIVQPAGTVKRQGEATVGGLTLRTIQPSNDPCPEFPIAFETLLERWSALPRMFAEPDGSFLWVGRIREEAWQLDGQIHDGRQAVAALEMRGAVPRQSLNTLIHSVGGRAEQLWWQLVPEGIIVDAQQFHRFLKRP